MTNKRKTEQTENNPNKKPKTDPQKTETNKYVYQFSGSCSETITRYYIGNIIDIKYQLIAPYLDICYFSSWLDYQQIPVSYVSDQSIYLDEDDKESIQCLVDKQDVEALKEFIKSSDHLIEQFFLYMNTEGDGYQYGSPGKEWYKATIELYNCEINWIQVPSRDQ
eukprot:TRINITY_DN9770_c0_g1_i1.p1 TRINITY_DN9770_c0_g1~~TRINITY_DN9770_c0_g1_i1.p1  ORF type:complete len:165 (-),score=31.45 TRINITY_DN9770_c0_g1_i1:88-582(-)